MKRRRLIERGAERVVQALGSHAVFCISPMRNTHSGNKATV